jgi:VWFA-related protein
MRRCVLLACLAAMVSPAFAAKRVTVEQLQQVLSSIHSKPDAEIARQLSDLQLTERLSTARLSQLEESLAGPEAQQTLTALADLSAFLNLPPREIPATAAPNFAEQRRVMALTITYVSKTLHQLPNFSATRITTRFQDQPQGYEKGGSSFVPAQPLARAGTASATVFYRDGGEVVNAILEKSKKGEPFQGLSTSGEFGPILATTLLDAAHSKLAWGHWEQGNAGPVAVFDYAVPSEKSHYEVSYCCFVQGVGANASDFRPFHQIAGYHGEIAVDPANGTVLRVTAQADLKPTDPLVMADILVEYGPVELGGSSYICPIKSISISQAQAADSNMAAAKVQFSPGHLQTLLNDASFVQYHLFHADAHILTAAEGLPEEHPTTLPPPAYASSANTSAPNPPTPSELPKASEDRTPVAPAATDAMSPPPPSSPASEASATTPTPEPAVASAPAEPDFDVPSLSGHNQGQVPVFKANSEAVVVDIVVTKGRDEPVTGLRKEDFQIMEDGKPQPVDFFEEHAPDNAPAVPLPQMPPNVYTNQPVAPPGDSVNVLLLDSLNTDREDQTYVHQQILNYLKTMDPGTRVAIFTLSSKLRMIQGFSTDSSALQAALNDPKSGTTTTAMSRSLQDKLDDQNEIGTLSAIQMSGTGIEAVEASQANHATYQADQRIAMTLQAMNYIARYLAGIPGRKNLIWFSSSFPISVFPNPKERLSSDTTRQYAPAVRETADLLTLSKIAVYPVGAEGVITEHPMEASNLGPTNTEGVTADNRMAGSTSQRQADPMVPYADEHAARGAKIAAMEQLAADTGGEAILNTNDLNKAMARAIQNGSHYYTLVYTPINKNMDGTYRHIEVKLNGGKYKLSYRRGYYADEAARNKPGTTETGTDDATPAADPLRPMLARGMPSATQLLYGVRVLPAAQQPAPSTLRAGGNDKLTEPLTRYSVDFLIRWTDVDLQLTPQGNQGGRIQLGVIAYSRDGKPVNWVGVTQNMNINPTTYTAIQRSGIPAHLEIDLPQQDVYLATGVYDWASKRAGTLEIPLNVLQAQSAATAPSTTQTKPN